MAVESGQLGMVKVGSAKLLDIMEWTFNTEAFTTRFGSSATAGYKQSVTGVKMGGGTIRYMWDGAGTGGDIPGATAPQFALKEGLAVTLLLYTNATEFYSVPAVIKSRTLTVDMDNGAATGGSATFETTGAWSEPTLA
jgi:hypothetical protein